MSQGCRFRDGKAFALPTTTRSVARRAPGRTGLPTVPCQDERADDRSTALRAAPSGPTLSISATEATTSSRVQDRQRLAPARTPVRRRAELAMVQTTWRPGVDDGWHGVWPPKCPSTHGGHRFGIVPIGLKALHRRRHHPPTSIVDPNTAIADGWRRGPGVTEPARSRCTACTGRRCSGSRRRVPRCR